MNPIGLASGVLPEFDAATVVRAAHTAGFDLAGLWVDPAEWTASHTVATRHALADTGIGVIDVEVLWFREGATLADHRAILDVGLELGAPNALCVSSDPDHGKTAEWFAQLCRHVEGTPLRVNFEFGWFSSVHDLAEAKAIVESVDHPNAAILIDPIHVDRSSTPIADIAALDRSLISYAQFCDASAQRPDVHDWLVDEGLRFLPAVNWVERGRAGDGNSVPRYHVVWGTARELVIRLGEAMRRARDSACIRSKPEARTSTSGRLMRLRR